MEFITQYGPLIIACVVLVAILAYLIYVAVTQPKKVKEWLIQACAKAEEALGSGTGKLKLREVYAMFIAQFPVFSKMISFETFQKWTEDALATLKDWIATNDHLAARVEGPQNEKVAK